MATPIGNLQDVTLRALHVLGEVDVVACEDTRHTRKLLERHGIRRRTLSLHKFNERRRAEEIVARLDAGQDVALVSDAGTPAVADPGASVVRRCAAAGHPVVPVPGPSALVALLSVAGLKGARHLFLGFLPHRAGERRRDLERVAGAPEAVVFLESPLRIAAALGDAAAILGATRPAVVGRELTKLYEEVVRGNLGELAAWAAEAPRKGEHIVAVEGSDRPARTLPEGTIAEQFRHAREVLGLPRTEAMRRVARERGIPRREVYAALLDEEHEGLE
ncbi:MAG: 16S rRNA (cytidine(1402)-2'-O)-methyltransferase [Acidobacteriota bacterium]